LAQPTGFGLGPCGLGPNKPTLKKKPNKEAHRAFGPMGQIQPMGFHLPHEKYIIF